jgi:hypothetical protein
MHLKYFDKGEKKRKNYSCERYEGEWGNGGIILFIYSLGTRLR